MAERVKSPTYAVYAFFMASFIYPIIVAWSWGGGFLATITSVGNLGRKERYLSCQFLVRDQCCLTNFYLVRTKATWTLPAAELCT